MAKDSGAAIEIAGVRLSSPDKVLYPEQGITKRELAEYYVAIADWVLPHVADRPITLVRCPTGRQRACFYQRHAGSGVPKELRQVAIPGFEKSGDYLYVRDLRGLVALVQMVVLEIHPWNARIDRTDRPDRVIFDLDPGEGVSFGEVTASALEIRGLLEHRGLASIAKTTGGKGLHVIVPIARRYGWDEVKAFARAFGEELARNAPDRYLIRLSKAERRGRILVDYLRNDPTSTAIAPYSTRARDGAPVALPIAWTEVKAGLDPRAFNLRSVPSLLQGRADPWLGVEGRRQLLPATESRPLRR
jgi:bifunctional non-homologous end joining protein LigD